jgi:long-chain fatty acid transport protein
MKRPTGVFAGTALALGLAALPLQAGNGHLLHGVGAVNSSMGGSGTGLPTDVISALHLNPALLTQLEGPQVAISTEVFVYDLSVTVESPDAGFQRRTTGSDGEPGVLPAVGWSYHRAGRKVAFASGLLAVAGFRTNWPTDPQNAMLAPQPIGFGKLNTELQVTKVPFAVAWQVNPRLSLGASLNLYASRLIINPLPVVVPDCNIPGTNLPGPPADFVGSNCYRPSTGVMVTELAPALQAGLYYEINSRWSVGLAYTSEIDTDPYEWNSEHANPEIEVGPSAFGQPRTISIDLDQPAIASAGIGFRPNPDLSLALDLKYVPYADTQGIGGSGGIAQDQRLVSIGWDDIFAYMFGLQWQASPKLELRGGLNFNDSPIRDEVTLNSGGTPSVFEEHYTVGASYALTPNFHFDLGAYYTPSNDKTGPLYGAGNQIIPNSSITLTNEILSALVGFSFKL